jgi:hypothetical protein
MRIRELLACGLLLGVGASRGGGSMENVSATSTRELTPGQREAFRAYAVLVDSALGTFRDITVFDRPSPTGPWELVNGQYAPVSVHGATPTRYVKDMLSDRPMMLPTRVQDYQGGDGQSSPYSALGRMPGSNPEVQWLWVARQYSIKNPNDNVFAHSGDIAVIGHHPRTGATTFYQFYEPAKPKSARVIVSPFSEGGAEFWSPIEVIADSFKCQRCHSSGPFIHTPWIDQVRVRQVAPDAPPAEPMVPSDPFGPYFFISGPGAAENLFAFWDSTLVARWGGGHLDRPNNRCTQCHRTAPDIIGLNANATRYAGMDSVPRNSFSVISDGFQTLANRKLPWMPPVSMPATDFYAGQDIVAMDGVWHRNFGADAAEVNRLTGSASAWREAYKRGQVVDLPAPGPAYRKILVDRPKLDTVQPGKSLWIVDTRMRANTAGDLHQWRFYGRGPAPRVRVAPVVYRRRAGDGSKAEFEVVFVGEASRYESGKEWLSVNGGDTFPLQQGDYFGVVFVNAGARPAPAVIPYTVDDWARLKWPDGTTRYLNGYGHWQGYVTMQVASPKAPAVGQRLIFRAADYRTYSFEFKNRL